MAIVQVPLEIPDEIYARIVAGEYTRMGGVVRDNAGQLVKLLGEAQPIGDAQEAAKAILVKLLEKRTVVGLALGVVAVATAAGGLAYRTKRKTKAGQLGLPPIVEDFGDSLTAYLEAARAGSLDVGIIDRLITDLIALEAEMLAETSAIELSTEQSQPLLELVSGHTRTLAKANAQELSDQVESAPLKDATVVELRPYLEAQRDLFGKAA